jgi:hypothetical protein
MKKYFATLALLSFAIANSPMIAPTLTLAQDRRVRIEASEGAGRYDDITWSALSCYSPLCAANQLLETKGNRKPYLLQIDQCESDVEAWEGNGELIPKRG